MRMRTERRRIARIERTRIERSRIERRTRIERRRRIERSMAERVETENRGPRNVRGGGVASRGRLAGGGVGWIRGGRWGLPGMGCNCRIDTG